MYRYQPYFVGLFFLFGLLSCEEAVDWEFQPDENDFLVIESIITDELKFQEVKLSLPFADLNDLPIPVSGAEVVLNDGQQDILFLEANNQPGRYLSEQAFAAKMQNNYRLEIGWEGQTLHAENQMVEILPFGPIKYKTVGTDSLSIEEVAPLYALNEQAMYEVDIDWTHLIPSNTSQAKQFFYTLSTVDVNELFRPPKEVVVFPKGSIIIEKKYALNPEFAAYIRSFLMETEWQGGIYDENSSSLPTNISNGGVGFFAVAAVLTDTLIAE